MGKNQHVTHRKDGKWQVLGEKNSKATAVFDTQKKLMLKAEILLSIKSQSF